MHVHRNRIVGLICLSVVTNHAFAEEPKAIVVELDSLKSTVPADWKVEKPINRLRSHQFRLPGAKGAKDAEVFIFPNQTKSVKENFERWKEMFEAPDGKTVDDIAKIDSFAVGKSKVSVLDIEGTWLYKSSPFDPKAKTEVRPNSRVVSVIFNNADGNYLIRLSGPVDTVKSRHAEFLTWIRNFK